MKAKHTIARIQSASVWQKIFCTLLAVTLLALMVPNGLRANATTVSDNNGEEVISSDGYTAPASVEKEYYAASDFATLGSSVTFDPQSFNMDSTTGYFTVQTAKVTVEQAVYFLVHESKTLSLDSIELNENGEISKQDLAMYFAAIGAVLPYMGQAFNGPNIPIPFGQLDFYEEEVHGPCTIDMEQAIEIPDYLVDLAEYIIPYLGSALPDTLVSALYIGAETVRYGLNAIIPSNTELGKNNASLNYPEIPAWPFTNDGSIFMINLYLGQGDTLLDILKGTNIVATRVIPMNPGQIADPIFSENVNQLMATSGQDNDAVNIKPQFLNWDLDLWGTGQSYSLQAWQSFYGPLRIELPEWLQRITGKEYIDLLNYTPLKIRSLTDVRATANFWDIEGLVPVHLDFGDAYVFEEMRSALRADGWTSTDFISGSTWTKYYWEETPTWFVYQDMMDKFGPWIFGGEKTFKPDKARPGRETWNYIFRDEMIWQQYWLSNQEMPDPIFPYWDKKDVPYPGPHWFETDNENWFGNLDKETTFSFSVYPVSPRGHVVHEGHGDYSETPWELIFDVADPVNKASVMFYNEYNVPLFNFTHQQYNKEAFDAWNDSGYYYCTFETPGDFSTIIPDYCYDTQIDHAIVYAWDEDPSKLTHDIYIPLRVEADQFDNKFATLFDFGMMDFSVERLMLADLGLYMPNNGIESFKVEYMEDGNLVADPYLISDPWQIAMFGLPMVTNGTITTWQNTLVTGFGCFMDFAHPFGDADPMTLFQNEDNFTASNTQHWYQCRITANVKPGYEFSTWLYDRAPISADVEGAGEEAIIIKEPGILLSHEIVALANPVAGAAIYGDEAAGTAIYGDAAGPAIYGASSIPDGNVATVSDGTAQTSDFAGIACTILALVALAAGITATRKIMVK